IARIAVVEKRGAGRLADRVDALSERRPLLRVEQREERHLGQNFGIGAHDERDYLTERSWTENESARPVGPASRHGGASLVNQMVVVPGCKTTGARRTGIGAPGRSAIR